MLMNISLKPMNLLNIFQNKDSNKWIKLTYLDNYISKYLWIIIIITFILLNKLLLINY